MLLPHFINLFIVIAAGEGMEGMGVDVGLETSAQCLQLGQHAVAERWARCFGGGEGQHPSAATCCKSKIEPFVVII